MIPIKVMNENENSSKIINFSKIHKTKTRSSWVPASFSDSVALSAVK